MALLVVVLVSGLGGHLALAIGRRSGHTLVKLLAVGLCGIGIDDRTAP